MNPQNKIDLPPQGKIHYSFGEFEILHRMDTSKLAHVYKVKQGGKIFALKRQRFKHDENADAKLGYEAVILKKVGDIKYFPRFYKSGVTNGYRYILMEFIHGFNLREALYLSWVAQQKVPYSLACWVTSEICRALDHLHKVECHTGQNLVHGDIKPKNIMISLTGEVKLIDLTLTGVTTHYAPRERQTENKVSAYSDIYATGHIFYELLHGKHLASPDLHTAIHSNLPGKIIQILTKSLDQNSSEKYKTMGEFLSDIEDFIHEENSGFDRETLNEWLEAIKKVPRLQNIRPHGHLLPTDQEGYLINDCALKKLDLYWLDAVNEVKAAYLKNLPDQIHSIYLRGSVPRGEGIEEISDIDSFAVVHGDSKLMDVGWISRFEAEFKKKYPFCTYVEFRFVPYDKILTDRSFFIYRFIIKVLSACIYGTDLSQRIHRFKPTLQIALAFHGNIIEVLSKASKEIQNASDPKQIRKWCVWVMKRLVRTGFGFFMEKERAYTRDLYPCYEVFAKYYPERESDMRKALEWAIAPSDNKQEILKFLDRFGTWLGGESQRIFSGKKS